MKQASPSQLLAVAKLRDALQHGDLTPLAGVLGMLVPRLHRLLRYDGLERAEAERIARVGRRYLEVRDQYARQLERLRVEFGP